MALTDSAIKAAKPKPSQYKLHDEKGLLLIVRPAGGKLWRLKYRFAGKEQQLTIGTYPEVGLKEARERRDRARKVIAEGKDPSAEKKREKIAAAISAGNTFKVVAEEFIAKRQREGMADATVAKCRWHLDRLDKLQGRPIAEIEAFELLAVLRKMETRGNLEAVRQVRSFASRVFRYGVATTRCKHDVAADLIGALTTPTVKHHAAIVDPVEVGALLRAIEGFQGQPSTHYALRLAPHVFVRPGELRHAEWTEFDLDSAIWVIPAARTKMRKVHQVPLSRQAIAILREMHKVSGMGKLAFPGLRGATRPLSENTFNAALRRLGYSSDEMTAHGFRAMASTLLNQSGKWRPDVVERALAHGERDKIRAAYNRAEYWEERVTMAQWWSNYLDTLRDGVEVIPIRA
ncbi:MAG: integrase arm-type DNA-binding domain-containing protein [Erythrobacter sp.]|nr:integrase arm-type DNA-binding domain-containing protein [Erythrobacter sp.]